MARLLGQGGFGSTYLATDSTIHKLVAIKELTPLGLVHRQADGHIQPSGQEQADAFTSMKKDFLTEARLLAKFRHPNIANVLRYFEANGTAYLVMAYEEGVTLRAWHHGPATISEEEIEAILLPICDGLALLHAEGLIHRDIKPDNIIVRPDNSPCLLDFGAAVPFARFSLRGSVDVIATPHYAPPEQLDPAGSQGPWTDIYALGATLYELITGQLPPRAEVRSRDDSLTSASELASGRYSQRLLALVDQCLALDFRERPSSISEVVAALRPDDDGFFSRVLRDVSLKMVTHFLNWARPSDGLQAEELAIFIVVFPILDVSWRLGEGLPSPETFSRLLQLAMATPSTLDAVLDKLVGHGFRGGPKRPTNVTIHGRLDQYAASFFLDREEAQWTYELTRKQLVKLCVRSASESDRVGFSALMEAVIDRARGRMKRELRKELDRVLWTVESDSRWTKRLRRSAVAQHAGPETTN